MVELSGRSAGVSVREIDLTGPRNVEPTGVPAGIIGTAERGPAFVPLTFGSVKDFTALFGSSDGTKFGPIAVAEWLRNANAVTYLRVLGAGDGKKRSTSGANAGNVTNAGFVVGQRIALDSGLLGDNPYAASGGPLGRTHFLGTYMSESAGSTIFSDAGIQIQGENKAAPILRGVIFAASGVIPYLAVSGSITAASLRGVASTSARNGELTGSVDQTNGIQNFVLLLNGHQGTDSAYPNIITASFDQTAQTYFANVLNKDPYKIQEAGHYLYAHYDIHPTQAVITGTQVVSGSSTTLFSSNVQPVAFLTTASLGRNVGSTTVPSYENFEDRFVTPASPTIISQKFGGNYIDLFRVWAISDGNHISKTTNNPTFKISIENVAKSTVNDRSYGTFDLIVRDYNDTDDSKVVLESYRGLTLDPSSDNYVARRIGDIKAYYDFDKNQGGQKIVVTGKYANVSNLIRVEMVTAVDNGTLDASALPFGFRGPYHLVTSGTDPMSAVSSSNPVASSSLLTAGNDGLKRVTEPPIPFRDNISTGVDPRKEANQQLYWGIQFEQKTSLSEPNASRVPNKSIKNFSRYFPRFQTSNINFSVGENHGVANAGGTVLDSDRFNNNLFALDRIQVRTGSDGYIDAKQFVSMSYIRNGLITTNETNKTRALTVDDLGTKAGRLVSKFTFFVQGGFDGVNVFDVDTDTLTDAAVKQEMDDPNRGQDTAPTVSAYKTGLSIMGNTSDVDIMLLAIPGIRHSIITDSAITTVESDRFDAMYVMDVVQYDTVNSVVTSSQQDVNIANTATNFALRGLNSSFAAAYFPNVVMVNPFTQLPTEVPPSVAVMGALALNDSIAHPWFAPAGYARGALQTTNSAAVKLSRSNLDTLQDQKINPIVSFPGSSGVVVWGQKTLQAAASALDRVNVRRLMIDIRRQVKQVGNSLLFEPNREATLNRFSAQVTPILKRIQEQQGINRFKVLIDTSTTTQADVENNTIRGKIYVEPTRTAELVSIDFVLTNLGATVSV